MLGEATNVSSPRDIERARAIPARDGGFDKTTAGHRVLESGLGGRSNAYPAWNPTTTASTRDRNLALPLRRAPAVRTTRDADDDVAVHDTAADRPDIQFRHVVVRTKSLSPDPGA